MSQNFKKQFVLLISFLLLVTMAFACSSQANAAVVVDGRADLSGSDLSSKSVRLAGTWEFYWNQLLTPQDIADGKGKLTGYITVPLHSWNENKNSIQIPAHGVATYRALIKTGNTDNRQLLVHFDVIRMASVVYIDGIKRAGCGAVAAQTSEYLPKLAPFDATVYPVNGQFELVIQAANLADAFGGMTAAPVIGIADILKQSEGYSQLLDYSSILPLFTIGFLLIGVYIFIPREKGLLFFAFVCFGNVGTLLVNLRSTAFLLIGLKSSALYQINIIADAVLFAAINHFVRAIWPDLLKLRYVTIFDLLFLPSAVASLLCPANYYMEICGAQIYMINIWYALVYALIIITCCQENRLYRHLNTFLVLLTLLCLHLPWIEIAFVQFQIPLGIPYIDYSGLGAVFFAIMYFANRFANEYKESDRFQKKSVLSETAFLHTQIKPHFLFNSLNAVISLCYIDGNRAGEVLTKLSAYLRNRFKIDDAAVYTTIEDELNLVKSYLVVEQARFGDRLQVKYQVDNALLKANILPFSIQPLVENAVVHGVLKNPEGGVITISVLKSDGQILIMVRDNGPGMPTAIAASLQNGTHGGSVGITNVNRRLKMHYNTVITVRSTPEGTQVQFQFPLKNRSNS